MKMYNVYKIASLLCFAGVIYYGFVNNIPMATHMFLCGVYADWLAEKEE